METGSAVYYRVMAPLNPEALPDDPAILKRMIAELISELRDQNQRNEQLQRQVEMLKRMHFGPRSERLVAEQHLFPFVAALTTAPAPARDPRPAPPAAVPRPQGHGRQKLPAHLPRTQILRDVPAPDRCCRGCGKEMRRIGEEVSEVLEGVPATLKVERYVRPKYACGSCQEEVVTADPPVLPIPKGMAGPGLLAQVLVSKYDDHLPLYRQSEMFARQGVEIARSTLCEWVAGCVELVRPLYGALRTDVLQSKKLHTDDTRVPVLDPVREHTRDGHLWVYLGDREHRQAVFDYTPNRTKEGPERFLNGYRGYLQADAYAGYDAMFQMGNGIEVACWAHARRYFFEAKETDPEHGMAALAYIGKLYDVERAAKELSAEERRAMRQEQSRPILDTFQKWLRDEGMRVLPRSEMGKAFGYAQGQWTALTRYVEDGELDIDNNAAERLLRAVAIGRKNWMFAGSDAGGERAAVIYSLVESCKLNAVEPLAYLRDVLTRLPTHSIQRVAELMPRCWKPPPNTS